MAKITITIEDIDDEVQVSATGNTDISHTPTSAQILSIILLEFVGKELGLIRNS